MVGPSFDIGARRSGRCEEIPWPWFAERPTLLLQLHLESHMPEVGELTPDFSLPSTSGDLSLRRYSAGRKLVIAFYVEDMTPG